MDDRPRRIPFTIIRARTESLVREPEKFAQSFVSFTVGKVPASGTSESGVSDSRSSWFSKFNEETVVVRGYTRELADWLGRFIRKNLGISHSNYRSEVVPGLYGQSRSLTNSVSLTVLRKPKISRKIFKYSLIAITILVSIYCIRISLDRYSRKPISEKLVSSSLFFLSLGFEAALVSCSLYLLSYKKSFRVDNDSLYVESAFFVLNQSRIIEQNEIRQLVLVEDGGRNAHLEKNLEDDPNVKLISGELPEDSRSLSELITRWEHAASGPPAKKSRRTDTEVDSKTQHDTTFEGGALNYEYPLAVLVFGFLVMTFGWSSFEWFRNSLQPVQSVRAYVAAGNKGGIVTFQPVQGEQLQLKVNSVDSRTLDAGDVGMLTYQGSRYHHFRGFGKPKLSR